jgi:molecular chaperone GrpE
MDASDEEFIPEDEAEEGPGLVKKLREKLKKAVEEKQEYLEGWQRARADFANYKKEEASMHADKESRIKGEFLDGLLSALDALELGIKHHPDDKNLLLLRKQFDDALRRMGIERFGAVGEEFNPHLHEALAIQGHEHTVISVERSGYKIDATIIRPAQVII